MNIDVVKIWGPLVTIISLSFYVGVRITVFEKQFEKQVEINQIQHTDLYDEVAQVEERLARSAKAAYAVLEKDVAYLLKKDDLGGRFTEGDGDKIWDKINEQDKQNSSRHDLVCERMTRAFAKIDKINDRIDSKD